MNCRNFNCCRLGLIALVLVCLSGQTFAQTTLYKASTVHTMAGDALSPGQVLVVDGKIEQVAKKIAVPEGANVVDLGESSVLMPGLIDPYSQVGLAGSNEVTKEVTAGFKAANALEWESRTLKRHLENGVTTLNVCPGTQNVIGGVAAIIKTDGKQKVIVNDDGALLATVCSDPASGNFSRARPDSIYVRQPTNRMGVVWIFRNTFTKAKAASTDSELANIKQAMDGKRPLMVVSRMSYDLNTVGTLADEVGFKPIIVGGQEAYKIKSILAERKYPIILQPQGTGQLYSSERSELCWNNAGVLVEQGLTVALSGQDPLSQARFAHRLGLDRDIAIQAITSTPAKILGIEKRVGSLEKGKDADMIVLNGDPLEITTSIRQVIVNGKLVVGQAIEKKKDN